VLATSQILVLGGNYLR